MLGKTEQIIRKNVKLIMRSRASALIIVLGPLFLILLLGLAFNTSDPYRITVGVYASNYSNLTEGMLTRLTSAGFDVARYPLGDACIDSVKTDESNVCIVFPAQFEISDDTMAEIQLHVDYSEINLVYHVVDVLSSQVSAQSQEIGAALAEDLLTRLSVVDAEVSKRVPTIVEVVAANDAIAQKTDEIFKSLNSIDLQINTANIRFGGIQEDLQQLKEITANTILEAKFLIDAIDTGLVGLSGNKSNLQNKLDMSDATFDSYDIRLKNVVYSLDTLMTNLSQEIQFAQSKLDNAMATRNIAVARLDEIKTGLTTTIDRLNQIQVGMSNIKTTVASFEVKNAERIVSPLTTRIVPLTSRKTHFNYLFPTLLVLVVMITSVLLGSTLVMSEKKSRAYFRNQITPTPDSVFLMATFLTTVVVVAIQALIYLIISSFFFDVALFGSISVTLGIVLITSSLFALLGILLGTLYKSEETAILAGITLSSIMLLFSSSILPLESMHPILKVLANWNPFVLGVNLLKEALFFDFGLSLLVGSLFTLFTYAAILFIVTLSVQRWLRLHTLVYYHKLPNKTGKMRLELLGLLEREGSILRRFFFKAQPVPDVELAPEVTLDPVEKSLLSDADEIPAKDATTTARETRKEISEERKLEIESELRRLKRELEKLG
ncbi:ABC transporter permease [Candidatus Woesearchaeota archaeon]|nr:ABC transporter permease [Candidatus Woesearchaeota archaeon]